MTLRRARLCGNDAHGFTFAREISSSFNGRRRLTGHRRGLAFVAVANPPRFSVFRESSHPFKIPVAPLSAVVSCELSFRDSFSNAARVIGKPFHWSFAPQRMAKSPEASEFEWRTRFFGFSGAIDTLRRVP